MKHINKILSICTIIGLSSTQVSSMEFGTMGNTSLGMGGAGVALRQSAWGLYYNPALIGTDPRIKFGYSLNIGYEDKQFSDLANAVPYAISDQDRFNKLLSNNALNVKSQNGIVLVVPNPKEIKKHISSIRQFKLTGNANEIAKNAAKATNLGNFSVGAFYSIIGGFSFDGKVDLAAAAATGSVDGQGVNFESYSFNLLEVPVGYGHTIATTIGNFNLGAAVKLMSARTTSQTQVIDQNTDIGRQIKDTFNLDSANSKSTSSVDVGFVYVSTNDMLSIGVVGKNLTSPTFNTALGTIKIKPQARVGVAYNVAKYLTISIDADITKNEIIRFSTQTGAQSFQQLVGGGVMLGNDTINVRAGALKDLQDTGGGAILTAGVGISAIDIAMQYGSETTRLESISNTKLPRNLQLRIGGNFVF